MAYLGLVLALGACRGGTTGPDAVGGAPGDPPGTVVATENFEDGALPTGGWAIGAQSGGQVAISADPAANYASSAGSLKGTYPVPNGGVYVWAGYSLSPYATRSVLVEFWAKMPGPKHGLKFLKVFGRGTSASYANTTFGLDYTGNDNGSMYVVSFGDGSVTTNDTANVIFLSGANPSWIGRSYGTASVATPQLAPWASANWGSDWHHFRLYVRFNSGTSAATEAPDGAFYVEIDGKVYVRATGLFNRHYSNEPIDRVELFGWSQGATGTTPPFEVWYDSVRITVNAAMPAA